ncbi:hypothetical protein GHT40_13970 [Citrobacter werkmanii]|uniref:hypothetical protein n=1 Tax=Citrobacter werkmanii TaxID=67827 RepID=UPI00190124E3|nr:hypothetical protein [Citrobacter werkmanii]MBJ9295401.1 hypothetical protein [Citrobacter werkmanii]
MVLHKFSHARELLSVADNTGIDIMLLTEEMAIKYIQFILDKYKPWKIEGHLSIGGSVSKLSTEDNEFIFSLSMDNVPAFIFFEQNYINKNNVLMISDASKISQLMENSHGMEYFISNEIGSYLIAVNWYSIEFTGDVFLN